MLSEHEGRIKNKREANVSFFFALDENQELKNLTTIIYWGGERDVI